MNILTGYISATSGEVFIDGHNIISEGGKAKKAIGYLPEQPAFYPEMRVDEHLNFICDLKRVTKEKKAREKHIAEICERVGISVVRGRMIRNLSKGYRQRVGFAQSLVGNPKLIILDEPTAGLDPSQIIEIRKLIKDSGKDSTVIVSSHILFEVSTVCDRVIVINEGQIIADDAPENLTTKLFPNDKLSVTIKGDPENVSYVLNSVEGIEQVETLSEAEAGVFDYIVTGNNDRDIREDMFQALAKADLPLLSSHSIKTSLEDVFLRLTREDKNDMRDDTE
jgi:ABC-2 type transport system ATP-binding protein